MELVNLGWRKLTDAGADVTKSGAYDLIDSDGHGINFTLEVFISDHEYKPLFHCKIDVVTPAEKWVWKAPSFCEHAEEIKELLIGNEVHVIGDGYGFNSQVVSTTKLLLRRLYKDTGHRYGFLRSLVMAGGFIYLPGEDAHLPWSVEGLVIPRLRLR